MFNKESSYVTHKIELSDENTFHIELELHDWECCEKPETHDKDVNLNFIADIYFDSTDLKITAQFTGDE